MVTFKSNRVSERKYIPFESNNWVDLIPLLVSHGVDTLVCGGISKETKALLTARRIQVVENVACTLEDIITAITKGELLPGYGFEIVVDTTIKHAIQGDIDCLTCRDRVCLKGQSCRAMSLSVSKVPSHEMNESARMMLDSAQDITYEEERTLCRLSELVYFCLEMKYRRLGIAYCLDLEEPTIILCRVLRRFFKVVPVCCKVGGNHVSDLFGAEQEKQASNDEGKIACNPVGQARVLNDCHCDLNVMVGLCMGVDCVFTRESKAPVTTLFVKDKSLANNPIGAVYSDYYLKEATFASVTEK